MPFKNLLKNIVSTAFDHVTMTWNYSVEVPASNLLCALIEILTISRACNMPKESLLPCRRSRCILESNEYLRQYAGRWIFASPRELFVRWEVEHHTEIKSRNQSSNFMRGFRKIIRSRHVARLQIWFKRGRMDCEDTYSASINVLSRL